MHPPSRPPASRRTAAIALAVIAAAALSVPLVYLELQPTPPGLVFPLTHIVVVMMENHGYDNLFGTYCTELGPNCPQAADGIPPGTCVPKYPNDTALGCVRPFAFNAANLSTRDLPHTWNSTVRSIADGRMNGFYVGESSRDQTFGHYDGSTVPIYWDLAENYALGDDFFSSALSYSLPNHWDLVAGAAPPAAGNDTTANAHIRSVYLDEANRTPTVQDLLNRTPSVSWKYYDWALTNYSVAIGNATGVGTDAFNYWNPMAARAESYTAWYDHHFVARDQFFGDAANGTLPNVSWIIPDFRFSDHPSANLTYGQAFIGSVVDAVESSRDWNSTALFIAWDDYGGFYDHVPPPFLDGDGLSFRVPIIAISPYTPSGRIVSGLGYFESLLHLMEVKFGLGCLTVRDCRAPLPLGYFDFQQPRRAPMLFPTNFSGATYPDVGQPLTSGALRSAGSPFAIDPGRWDTGPPPADAAPDALD